MLDVLKSAMGLVIPEKIEDANQEIVAIKLAAGIIFGFTLVAIAFAILTGVGQVVIEEFGSFKLSNSTLLIFLGVFFVWLTLTKVGIKSDQQKK